MKKFISIRRPFVYQFMSQNPLLIISLYCIHLFRPLLGMRYFHKRKVSTDDLTVDSKGFVFCFCEHTTSYYI